MRPFRSTFLLAAAATAVATLGLPPRLEVEGVRIGMSLAQARSLHPALEERRNPPVFGLQTEFAGDPAYCMLYFSGPGETLERFTCTRGVTTEAPCDGGQPVEPVDPDVPAWKDRLERMLALRASRGRGQAAPTPHLYDVAEWRWPGHRATTYIRGSHGPNHSECSMSFSPTPTRRSYWSYGIEVCADWSSPHSW